MIMKKILITLAAVFALVSCEMDFFSSDTISSAMLKENPGAAVYTTDGVLSLLKTSSSMYTHIWRILPVRISDISGGVPIG